jgi:hypothetical protein
MSSTADCPEQWRRIMPELWHFVLMAEAFWEVVSECEIFALSVVPRDKKRKGDFRVPLGVWPYFYRNNRAMLSARSVSGSVLVLTLRSRAI